MNKTVTMIILGLLLVGMVFIVLQQLNLVPMPSLGVQSGEKSKAGEGASAPAPEKAKKPVQAVEASPKIKKLIEARKASKNGTALKRELPGEVRAGLEAISAPKPVMPRMEKGEVKGDPLAPMVEALRKEARDRKEFVRPKPLAAEAKPAPAAPGRDKKELFPPVEDAEAAPPAAKKTAQLPSGQGANHVRSIGLTQSGQTMVLRVVSDKPIGRYKYFTLKSPGKLVLDLSGEWKVAKNPAVPDNKIVKSVRVGGHPDKLRIVTDLYADPSDDVSVLKKSDTEIEITIK